MKDVVVCCVFLGLALFVYAEEVTRSEVTTTEGKAPSAPEVIELSADSLKKV